MFSCEVYPPKSPAAQKSFREELPRLLELPFQLVTCTHGAGGSELGGTCAALAQIRSLSPVATAAHVCCWGGTEEMMLQQLQEAVEVGATWIMALRGDRPCPTPEGQAPFSHAIELVELIRTHHPELKVAVAGYPETHPEASDPATDLAFLKQKVEAGADSVICQFCFDSEVFFRFRDRCEKAGIQVPLVPGILPIRSLENARRLSECCGAHFPAHLAERLEQAEDELEAGLEFNLKQVSQLQAGGVAGMHFYSLNQSQMVGRMMESL